MRLLIYLGNFKVQAFAGALNDARSEQLRKLVDSEELVKLKHDTGITARFREGQVTQLVIPREDNLQHLQFFDFFGVSKSPREIGGLSGNNTVVDHDEQIIGPLRKWLAITVETDKLTSITTGDATNRAPDGSKTRIVLAAH